MHKKVPFITMRESNRQGPKVAINATYAINPNATKLTTTAHLGGIVVIAVLLVAFRNKC